MSECPQGMSFPRIPVLPGAPHMIACDEDRAEALPLPLPASNQIPDSLHDNPNQPPPETSYRFYTTCRQQKPFYAPAITSHTNCERRQQTSPRASLFRSYDHHIFFKNSSQRQPKISIFHCYYRTTARETMLTPDNKGCYKKTTLLLLKP